MVNGQVIVGAADAKTRGPPKLSAQVPSRTRGLGVGEVLLSQSRCLSTSSFLGNHGRERIVGVCQDGDSDPRNSRQCVQAYFFPHPPRRLNNLPSTELIKRLRILTLTLLPLEVDPKSINDPTSRVITPKVIAAYTEAAGTLVEAVCNNAH